MRIVATVTLLLSLLAADVATAAPRARLKAFDSCKDLVGYARDGALRTRGGVGVVGRAVPPPAITIATPPVRPLPPTMETTTGAPAPRRRRSPIAGPRWADRPRLLRHQHAGGRRRRARRGQDRRPPDRRRHRRHAARDRARRRRHRDARARRLRPPAAAARRPRAGDLDQGRVGGDDRRPPDRPEVAPQASVTVVTEIDISAAPKVLRTMDVEGRFIDARQNGAVARLVIDSVPDPIIPRRRRHAAVGGQEGRREPLPRPHDAQEQHHRPHLQAQPRARATPSRAPRSSPASTCWRS